MPRRITLLSCVQSPFVEVHRRRLGTGRRAAVGEPQVCLSFRGAYGKGRQVAFCQQGSCRDWVWGRPSSLGTNNPFEEQPEKCDTAVEEMQQWMHATVPTLDTARATARRESEVTVLLSCSTG